MRFIHTEYKILLAVIILIALAFMGNQLKTEEITIKIDTLISQQKIKGNKESMSTDIRYLIVSEKETFVSESNWLQFKFNNSDVFYHMKMGKTYTVKVSGYGNH